MILLDTNAAIFLLAAHPRARPLAAHAGNLALSPISILEIEFLVECGKVTFDDDPGSVMRNDPRWLLDDPSLDIVACALSLSWTRDPF